MDSVGKYLDEWMQRMRVVITKDVIADVRRQEEGLHACISTQKAMEFTDYRDTKSFLKKFTNDPEVIKRKLFIREGSAKKYTYKWRNPEWSQWYHDEYWRRNG